MKKSIAPVIIVATVAGCALVSASLAQTRRETPVASATIDPASLAALTRMGEYVASQKSFEFKTSMAFDVIAANGQTVSVLGTGRYIAQRPDKLRVDLENDLFDRSYYYDGKQLTVVAPSDGYFGRIDAKPTIRETLSWAAQTFALELPLADLFDFDGPDAPTKRVLSGFLVGTVTCSGQPCDHWAFQTRERDWEIWIRTGDKPAPLKFVMINRADPAFPRFESTLTWSESSAPADNVFTFSPSGEQRAIDFLHATKSGESR